jgi:hypothetical protein
MASKYWDASAPLQRTTKQQAKEKLSALNLGDTQCTGARNLHKIV